MKDVENIIEEVLEKIDPQRVQLDSFLERKYIISVMLDTLSLLVRSRQNGDAKTKKIFEKHLVMMALFFRDFSNEMRIKMGEDGIPSDTYENPIPVIDLGKYYKEILLLAGPLYAVDSCPTAQLRSKLYNLHQSFYARGVNLASMIFDVYGYTLFLLKGRDISVVLEELLTSKKRG